MIFMELLKLVDSFLYIIYDILCVVVMYMVTTIRVSKKKIVRLLEVEKSGWGLIR